MTEHYNQNAEDKAYYEMMKADPFVYHAVREYFLLSSAPRTLEEFRRVFGWANSSQDYEFQGRVFIGSRGRLVGLINALVASVKLHREIKKYLDAYYYLHPGSETLTCLRTEIYNNDELSKMLTGQTAEKRNPDAIRQMKILTEVDRAMHDRQPGPDVEGFEKINKGIKL
jgi:hypothetical protein